MPQQAKRAEPPRPPAVLEREPRGSAREQTQRARMRLEQRSMLRGLILLALIVLIASLARAGFDRLFVPGWWRQW